MTLADPSPDTTAPDTSAAPPPRVTQLTVRQVMQRDYTALRADQTIADALQTLRTGSVGEKVVYFYVIDAEGRLSGVVPTRRLLMSRLDQRIEEVMLAKVTAVCDTETPAHTAELLLRHRLLALPVVDDQRRLVGVVDVSLFTDEIQDLSGTRAAEDVFQLIGVRLAQRSSPWAGFTNRFPWLLCNIGGGMACAFLAGHYEAFLDKVIILALFIPVVLALAESVSIQSMTLTLQGLRGERVDWGALWRSLYIEIGTAGLLGLACGGMVGLIAWIWKHHLPAAAAIGGSIALAILTASLLGVVLPAAVRLLRGDPKIAAGPIVLAAADILTLLFYFNLAGALLG